MKFSGIHSRLQHRNYIQDSLEYLSFNGHNFENDFVECNLVQNSYQGEVICLGKIDDDKHQIINDTIILDDSQILSELGENYNNIQNLSKSLNNVDVTINIDDSFTDIDDYEVLSEVGNDTIELDMSENEITLNNLAQTSIQLDNADSNDTVSPNFQIPSRKSSPWDAAIDELLALGRKGLLEVEVSNTTSINNLCNRRIKVCKFFLKGECKYGSTGRVGGICKFRHEGTHIHNRFQFGNNKRKSPKRLVSGAGYASPAHKGIAKRLQRNSLHQVKRWITSDAKFRS